MPTRLRLSCRALLIIVLVRSNFYSAGPQLNQALAPACRYLNSSVKATSARDASSSDVNLQRQIGSWCLQWLTVNPNSISLVVRIQCRVCTGISKTADYWLKAVTNKSVFSYLRALTTWHCPHSLAARRRCWSQAVQQSIDIHIPTGPTATNLQQRICCCGPMLGQTDRHRTVTCSAYCADSENV